MSETSAGEIPNITCSAFAAMPEAEKQLFVLGVANGRGMTAGLFETYASAAQEIAASKAEREAIAVSYQTIREMMLPLLEINVTSLLNGITVACKRSEFQDKMVIEAIASVHLDAARALSDWRKQSSS